VLHIAVLCIFATMPCLRLPSILSKAQKAPGIPGAAYGDSSSDEGDAPRRVAPYRAEGPSKLFADGQKAADKLVAVLVTIASGQTYDEMFRQNRPTTVPGEHVSTYLLDCKEVAEFHRYLNSEATPTVGTIWQSLIQDIRQVQPDSVTLNWECCSDCNGETFPTQRTRNRIGSWCTMNSGCANPTMTIIGLALQRGFTVMCSDFSLKALIAEWSEEHLGPNPFVKMGECDMHFRLEFIPSELKNEDVPQQLQVVGELCAEQGSASVQAMGGTIVYTINPHRQKTEVYTLKVLTVANSIDGLENCSETNFGEDDVLSNGLAPKDAFTVPPSSNMVDEMAETADARDGCAYPEAMMCKIGEGDSAKIGMAGHVTLTYSSGGQLVTSMGHWIELTRINTSEEELFRVAAKNFGQLELQEMQADLECQVSEADRDNCRQKWARSSISKSVPTRMKCRTKY